LFQSGKVDEAVGLDGKVSDLKTFKLEVSAGIQNAFVFGLQCHDMLFLQFANNIRFCHGTQRVP
jgi:hypothetical protein